MIASHGKGAIALRYALAPACIGAAILLRVSPLGPFFYPTEPFILAVLAAAWFGGAGPGVLAAFLSAVTVPQLITLTQLPSAEARLLWGFFDLPRFIPLALTGAAVGWGAASLRRARTALRGREREVTKARDELERAVAERTAHLLASEERYARAMEATAAGHWEWDLVTREVFHSARFRELYGIPLDEKFADREAWKARQPVSPSERKRQEEALQAAIADPSKSYDIELSFEVGPGEVRWLRSRGKVFRSEDGTPLRIAGATSDITAQKRAEEALRESEQRYERVMLASGAGIWDWDVVKDEFYVSPRFLEMGGLPPDTVFSGREDFMRRGPLYPEDREKWQQAVRQLFASAGSRLSMELRSSVHGETRWRRLEGIAFRDASGRVVRWTGSTTDISERKRAEEALRRSEERFALALAASNDGIWDWDIVTDQQFFSGRAQRVLGLEPGPTVRPRSEWHTLREFHPEDAPRRIAALERHLAGETPVYEGEWRVRRAGGNSEYRWVHARGVCVRDEAGRPVRMVGALTDVDGRKRMEAALRESEERYSLAMAASEEGHFDVNVDTDELFNSERMNEIYGFAPGTHFENRDEYLKQFRFYGNDADTYHAAIRAAMAKGGPERYEFEYRILRPSGEMRWLRTRGKVTRDAEGRARRRTGVVADITAAKLAQEALLQSQERYALAMEAAADGHTDWNFVTGEFYISPRLLRILGYAQDTTFADRADWVRRFPFHPEDRPRWETAIAAHFAGTEAKFRMDLRIVVRGETRWVAFTFIASRDPTGKPVRWTGTITDIHDAKLAEEALRESQERYALAVAGSDDGIWDADFATGRVFVSARGRELAGMPPGQEVVPLDEWVASLPLHPDDVPLRNAAFQAHLSGEAPAYEIEVRLLQPDGAYRWRRLHGLCLRDASGKPQRMAGSISDVDARRRAEEALRLSEERYALALEASEEGHFDNDLQSGEIFVSARVNEIYGLPHQAGISKRIDFLNQIPFHPDDRGRALAELSRQDWEDPAGSLYELECRIVPRPGEIRWIHSRAKIVRDAEGRPRRRVGVVADITERKLAEEARRLSEERYALAAAGSNDGIWDWDLRTHKMFVSERAQRIFGLEPGPTERPREAWHAMIAFHPDDHLAQRRMVEEYLSGERSTNEGDWRVQHRDGGYRWIRIRSMLLRSPAGEPVRMAGSVSDIDARKKAEAALRLSEARYALAMEVAEEGHFDWNVQSDEIFASAQALRVIGLPDDAEYRTRAEVTAGVRYHPDDWPRISSEWRAALAGKALEHEFEYRILRGEEPRSIRGRWKIFRDEAATAQRVVGVIADITERKLAEEARRLSEERYALAMQASGEGHWDWKIDTDEFYASPRYLELAGFPPDMKYSRREDVVPFIPFHPDDLASYEAAVAAHFAGETPRVDLVIRVVPRGELHWLHVIGSCTRDAGGRPVRWAGSVSDITRRKLAEEALRASEERYSLAMEASEEGYVDADIDTDEFVTSERLNEIFGIPRGTRFASRSDFLRHFRFYGNDAETYRSEIRAVTAKGGPDRYEFSFRIVLPSGEVRWLWTRGVVARDAEGRAHRRIGVVADITARKVAEEALRASEERYSLALEASEEGHFDTDLASGAMFVSARLNEIYGFPRRPEIANRVEYLKRIPFHPDDRHLVDDIIRPPAWADPELNLNEFAASDFYEFECRIIPRPGEVRWIHTRGKVTRDAEGRARRRVGVVADITDRKLAEEALRLSEERYALAMEAADECHFDWNPRTDEIFASGHMKKVLGLPPDHEFRTRGEMVARVGYFPGDRERLEETARRVLASGALRTEFEYRILRGAEVRWLRARWKIDRDAAGVALRVIGVLADVTERKLAAEALRESESRFRTLVELNSNGFWEQDENLRYVSSPITTDITGHDQYGNVGRTRWELPGDPTPLSCSWQQHQADLAARRPFRDFEYSRRRPDGEIGYYSSSGAPIFDDQGRFKGYYGVASDITQRKRFEEELRSRKEMLEVAQKAARAVPWEWRNGAPPEVNKWLPEMCALFGLPPGGFDGTAAGWWKLVHPDDLPAVKASIRQALATGEINVEYRVTHPDGKVRWLNQKGRAFLDANGKPARSIGFMFDVTERRKVEEDLRSRQEMLDLAQKSARATAFEWKIGTGEGENRWSPDLEAMYGFKPGTYDGTFETWKKLVHPEDWPAVKEAIHHAHETGEVASEYRVAHPDGSVHWLQAKGRMFFDAGGNATRMVGFMQDITLRKQAEEELRRMEQELRRAQRLESMGTLAGGIAHDFNNILGAILGYGEMALRDAKKGSRLRRDMDAIMAAGERGRALVDRILAFSRSGVGERVPVHVEEVVREALDQVAAKLPENVTIAPRLRAGRAAMLGDSTQVHQVVMNLASNAVQAMPQGGMLRVSLETQRIEAPRAALIGTISTGEYVVLKVADAGTGIRPEVLERMFDPFFTTKEVGVGSGLGLSLVHGIVATVGGAVDVATELGKGSTFTVYLPRSGDAPANKAADDSRPLPRGDGERVLVVDDEEPLVRLATETLESLGYAPVGFTSSTNALEEFGANPGRFDAILTDERMPGVTGSVIIREVRRINPSIPILLMTGFVGGAAALKARELGANDVLKKPLLARELATSLAKALRP